MSKRHTLRLIPTVQTEIKSELNQFKRDEMEVHVESQHNTRFH
jgi:hypothetical protein